MSSPAQPGILADVPAHGAYLSYHLRPGADAGAALRRLAAGTDGVARVVGLGPSLVRALGAEVEGLHPLEVLTGPGLDVPSTPAALWVWLRGEDPGKVLHEGRAVAAALGDAFTLAERTAAFRYLDGHDLTGYEDGTENPEGDEAEAAALVAGDAPGLAGGSFVAVQRWVHDLAVMDAMAPGERDHVIGRRLGDNEELEDAPDSAHVKRTAQEDYDPPAFMLRRSMPWADARGEGLVFVAFGCSLVSFERQMRRMAGLEDGVTDGLFRFTRPVTGAAYFCPPLRDGELDLRAVGLG